MGYVGTFVALTAFIVSPSPAPFAGYYLGREVYAFNQTMGITMMGGFMSWLWIIQGHPESASSSLRSTTTSWLGMSASRVPSATASTCPRCSSSSRSVPHLGTPRTLVVTMDEVRAMAAPTTLIGVFGSCRGRTRGQPDDPTTSSRTSSTVAPTASHRSWAGTGMAVQWRPMGIAAVIVT